jgi:hypothetical protein
MLTLQYFKLTSLMDIFAYITAKNKCSRNNSASGGK